MKEDYFAKYRNGHQLKDTYDKEKNTLDINSLGLYPANVLSNLAQKAFVFQGVQCGSIEGFLQSLKYKNTDEQAKVCLLYGGSAKNAGKKSDWMKSLTLYWKGTPVNRLSAEYNSLIKKAYYACWAQNELFREALQATRGMTLTHQRGRQDKTKTILTEKEFCEILQDLRDNY